MLTAAGLAPALQPVQPVQPVLAAGNGQAAQQAGNGRAAQHRPDPPRSVVGTLPPAVGDPELDSLPLPLAAPTEADRSERPSGPGGRLP